MKKILVLVIAMSLLFGSIGVMANPSTNITANVCSSVVSATVTDSINFGNILPGKNYTASTITVTPDASTVSVRVSVSGVTDVIGTLFSANLLLDNAVPTTKSWDFACTSLSTQCGCTWEPVSSSTIPTLAVPSDYSGTGAQTGAIIYLVTAI